MEQLDPREQQRRALLQLLTNRGVTADEELMAACPHLNDRQQTIQALRQGKVLAIPGIAIWYGYWELSVGQSTILTHRRLPKGFAPGARHGLNQLPSRGEVLRIDTAIDWAEANWPEHLVHDQQSDSVRMQLRGPNPEWPLVMVGAGLMLVRLEQIARSDNEHAFDQALLYPTTDPVARAELAGSDPGVLSFCWRCGHHMPTEKYHCMSCGVGSGNGVPSPVPLAMAVRPRELFEQNGHTFTEPHNPVY